MKQATTLIAFLITTLSFAQGVITGRVYDAGNNDPLPSAAIKVEGSDVATITDFDGLYTLNGLQPGLYNITVSILGYRTQTEYEVQVTNAKPAEINFAMSPSNEELEEVTVSAQNVFAKDAEAPVSLQKLGINEIQRNPGGNQDISRVIQSLPGVASSVAFRNDLIIRGGGPNENRFYLDGIEIPAINHFATQGSSGGPVGMINVNFIRDVDFYTSAFPSDRGNALSSVMEINLKDGRRDRVGGIFQVGASEVGLTLEGPISEKTTFLVSARQSYLQFLFSVLELPFLPTYNDFQFKIKSQLADNQQLTILGLGAIDRFKLNLDANETEEQRYLLNSLPVNEQWNYSIGAKYTYFQENGFTNVVLSRFMLNNTAYKYEDNDEAKRQLLDYQSQEIENKLRIEQIYKKATWQGTFGVGFEEAKYNTSTLDRQIPNFELQYDSDIRLYKYSIFANYAKRLLNERLSLSFGLRTDANTFSSSMNNPLDQLSPRIAVSYAINDEWSIDANWGIYYQLPPYTTIGYRDTTGNLVNTDIKYIRATHYVLGVSRTFTFNAKLSVEGFYKQYSQYPFLYPDSISLANLGGDFGVVGNRPATSTNDGRAYGMEITWQQKLYKGWFGIAAFTFVRSEFEDRNEILVPASWDNRFLASITAGKKFANNWELGIQYQFLGGTPYTPYDIATSANRQNWDNLGRAVPDYSRLNTLRLSSFNRLNIRVDKKWYLQRFNLDVYIDIQNALGSSIDGQPYLTPEVDANGDPVIDPNDNSKYLLKALPNAQGTVVPSIGLIFEF
ncbi:MAG: TonB-dependent receptor [Bacteroidetes bacterium]|uniref:TonB-dependent receptor n=1 Tax=Phaeocystidibacter marisrubri TaxID=1577780 RepID=A0A6L3ZJE2_9FLAO|nr:TonB-dependent receptor [Phaeocystidibacter marisrubri]KAB2818054.1 TonB-dependent receptor [Phaeocystidibacter marisrubri]TNE26107.1 MAG: TonB-dependent receptor [Bacteroidota bacterium]GGH72184.1 collagen-binding protein [Phaeocystidibacter marisrubri]